MRAFSVATGGSQDPRAAFWQVTDPQKWPFPSLSQPPGPPACPARCLGGLFSSVPGWLSRTCVGLGEARTQET